MIDGSKIILGGKEYTVPPMNFKTLIKASPLFKSLEKLGTRQMPSEEDFTNIVTLLQMALQRNYPEITFDEVAESLDLTNIQTIMTKIMMDSGAQKSSGEAMADSQ